MKRYYLYASFSSDLKSRSMRKKKKLCCHFITGNVCIFLNWLTNKSSWQVCIKESCKGSKVIRESVDLAAFYSPLANRELQVNVGHAPLVSYTCIHGQ